jgi:hypothetical protein
MSKKSKTNVVTFQEEQEQMYQQEQEKVPLTMRESNVPSEKPK